jgi:hypothetical protein
MDLAQKPIRSPISRFAKNIFLGVSLFSDSAKRKEASHLISMLREAKSDAKEGLRDRDRVYAASNLEKASAIYVNLYSIWPLARYLRSSKICLNNAIQLYQTEIEKYGSIDAQVGIARCYRLVGKNDAAQKHEDIVLLYR